MSIGKLLRDATLAAVPARGGRPNVESYSGRHMHGSADGGDGCPRTGYGLSAISYRITTYDSSRRLTVWPTSRLAVYFPTPDLPTSDSPYWHTHSLLRPSDHIQAAALAFASGSKMSLLPNGVDFQVERMNWKSP
jgi:hypothetical protein